MIRNYDRAFHDADNFILMDVPAYYENQVCLKLNSKFVGDAI